MTDEDLQGVINSVLRTAHQQGKLAEVIGTALGKTAIFILMIDVVGAIISEGNSRGDTPNSTRDRIMIRKMSTLIAENMQSMMREAGREAKEEQSDTVH